MQKVSINSNNCVQALGVNNTVCKLPLPLGYTVALVDITDSPFGTSTTLQFPLPVCWAVIQRGVPHSAVLCSQNINVYN
jgi:hypothetical protein